MMVLTITCSRRQVFCFSRNMLIGSTSYNEYKMEVFPGLKELLSVSNQTEKIEKEISKHITEIMIAMTVAQDYSIRSIIDPALYTPN